MNNFVRHLFKQGFLVKKYSSTVPKTSPKNLDSLLISCKRRQFNQHYSCSYDKLDEVPLASKGWAHSKAKGDFFTIHPCEDDYEEQFSNFSELEIDKKLIESLKTDNIKHATDFQNRAFAAIRSGSHTLLAAETGCGKTVAYLLPIIQDIIENKNDSESLNTPVAVILVPNRELAYQVGEVANNLGSSVGIEVKVVTGGNTKKQMLNPTFNKIDILVATPGAIGKLSSMGIYKLHETKYTVFDEADTLLDDSFTDRINGLILRMPQSQYILVSATIPKNIPASLTSIENNMKHITSAKIHKPLLNITQKFLRMSASSKPGHLLQIAKTNKHPLLIFTNKNSTSQWVAFFLRENGVSCSHINGDMHHTIRIDQWNQFVRGDTKILSATDVGSRGLNTIQVRHVLNYDFPLYAADYLHRVGRVGRLGSPISCKVTNFISSEMQVKLIQQIELAVRRHQSLENVDGNITHIIQRRIARSIQDTV